MTESADILQPAMDPVVAARLTALYRAIFGAEDPGCYVHAEAPGRLEMAGNHTDHQGGLVISAALDQRIYALATPRADRLVKGYCDGFGRFELDLDENGALEPHADEAGSFVALIRGMVAGYVAADGAVGGFNLVTVSTLPAGAGVSSSAAFQMVIGAALRALDGRTVLSDDDRIAMALQGQAAEQRFFGKNCGAQDQITSAFGGAVFMDFAQNPPAVRRVDADLSATGYRPVLIDSRVDHSAYIEDYAAVPADMTAVARYLGAARLGDVPQEAFETRREGVEQQVGIVPALRACHYYEETQRVARQFAALTAGDFAAFAALAGQSGASNRTKLCNVTPSAPAADDLLAGRPQHILELCDRLLPAGGSARIHGGGFGGCILAFVPEGEADAFCAAMDEALGYAACRPATLGATGARAWVTPTAGGLEDERRLYWTDPTPYGTLELSINLVKPEKDPRAIAAAATAAQPAACALCGEIARYDAAAEAAVDPSIGDPVFALDGETWRLHFSPYGYYPLHCIALPAEHRPMCIDGACLGRLLGCVQRFPRYFMGSNADLPIVGGSILAHDHFQGGGHVFPLMRAAVARTVALPAHPAVSAAIVDWPASTLRLTAADPAALQAAATAVVEAWRVFACPELDILPATDAGQHSTVTAIAYRQSFVAGTDPAAPGNGYVMDLILRNNRTTAARPYGLFHPDESLHHIKKENIGLIEAMGLAVLPSRLVYQLPGVVADRRTQQQVTDAFTDILRCVGVFKQDEAGNAGWDRFVRSING